MIAFTLQDRARAYTLLTQFYVDWIRVVWKRALGVTLPLRAYKIQLVHELESFIHFPHKIAIRLIFGWISRSCYINKNALYKVSGECYKSKSCSWLFPERIPEGANIIYADKLDNRLLPTLAVLLLIYSHGSSKKMFENWPSR